jgi:hypothetical protein
LRRIKPHTPPLVRAPVNSFEFQPCGRTPQAGDLTSYRRHGGTLLPPTPSHHRLQPGLPGYLILFAPLAFAPQRQCLSRKPPSPQMFLLISTHFTATPGIPLPSPALQPSGFSGTSPVEPGAFTQNFLWPPTRPLRPIIPNNACPPRITAAAGTELAGASSRGTVIFFFPRDRSLRSENLLPPRGVAASGLPPLRKIPHCCLP